MRLDALESGPDRKATRRTDHEALARLAKAGIDSRRRARLVAQRSLSMLPSFDAWLALAEGEQPLLDTVALRRDHPPPPGLELRRLWTPASGGFGRY